MSGRHASSGTLSEQEGALRVAGRVTAGDAGQSEGPLRTELKVREVQENTFSICADRNSLQFQDSVRQSNETSQKNRAVSNSVLFAPKIRLIPSFDKL